MAKIPLLQAIEEICADITLLKVKTAQTARQPRFIYKLSDTPRGFTWETWGPRPGTDNSDEDGFNVRWGGPVIDGIPTHTDGAPTTSGVETDTRFSQQEQGQDEHRLCYWIYNDRDVPIEIQDTDTRAESLRVYMGCDCPSSLVHERYQTGGGIPYHSRGERFLTLPPGAITKMTVLIHDPGADFSGFRPIANEVGSEDTFEPASYQDRPFVECREIIDDACDRYSLIEGESFKPIRMECHDCGGGNEGLDEEAILALVGDHAEPATIIPVADNEVDAAIRTGQIGTSTLYARADHNHPIIRQSNPGDPIITVGGNFELQINAILDRWSDEESYSYAFRTLVNQPAGTGWGWINIPNIAGFQRPKITGIGSYRFASTAVQEDNSGGASIDGASPRGPLMAKEVHHWSSTQRLYGAYFRRDNDFRAYIEYVVEYTRS